MLSGGVGCRPDGTVGQVVLEMEPRGGGVCGSLGQGVGEVVVVLGIGKKYKTMGIY